MLANQYIWDNPLYSVKLANFRALDTDVFHDTIWATAMSNKLAEMFDVEDFYGESDSLHGYLIDNVVAQVEALEPGQPLHYAMLGIDIDAKILATDGTEMHISHVICFNYEDDGLHILIVHLTDEEVPAFIEERRITEELMQ